MNDPKKPNDTQGTDDTVMPEGAGASQDVNSISENTDGDGQHKIKKEVKEAIDLPQKGSA